MSFGHLNHGKSPLEVTVVTGAGADIVEFESAGAITAAQLVALDASGDIVQAVSSAAAIGVALEAASGAGEIVRVCVAGPVEGVASQAGVSAGDPVLSAAAGTVDTWGAASTIPCFGVAQTNEGGNGYISMYVFRKY